jgi:hypothetical protein
MLLESLTCRKMCSMTGGHAVQLWATALWDPKVKQERVGAGSLGSAQDLWQGFLRLNLGTRVPGLPAALDGAQRHIKSVHLAEDRAYAVVVCTQTAKER